MICLAFWFGEVRAIVVAYNISMTIISGQYIPVRLFPEHIINIMEFTPLLYLVDFPVSIATGRIPLEEWAINFIYSISWCIVMWFIGLLVYNKGSIFKDYENFCVDKNLILILPSFNYNFSPKRKKNYSINYLKKKSIVHYKGTIKKSFNNVKSIYF